MLEFIKIINSDYAGVLSLLSSLIMVVVTIIYVGHTKRQANYAKESAELVAKQMKIDKQPCIVPYVTDSYGSAWDTTDYIRMQLGFTIKLRNVGDSPAINVYTLADIELQFSEDSAGNKKLLPASLLPGFTQALSAEEETDINIHFETSEVKALICELRKASEKNWERLRTNPSHHHYTGAKLIICYILHFNGVHQRCKNSIVTRILERFQPLFFLLCKLLFSSQIFSKKYLAVVCLECRSCRKHA